MKTLRKDDIDNSKIDTRRVGDSAIMINGKEYFALNVTNAVKATGKHDAKEYFNDKKQQHHNWFILDLETGKRGLYPGCKLFGTTNKDNAPIKESRSDYADTLIELAKGIEIELLERFNRENQFWYMCKYSSGETEYEGYIRAASLENIEYR